MKNSPLHKSSYHIIRSIGRPYIHFKYRFTTDRLPEIGEPYILLSNHTTEEDMLLTIAASRKHMYFVCGEHLLRNPIYGKALGFFTDPIPVQKGGVSLEAVREILKRLRTGYNVCMFPEGKRSYHGETIPSPVAIGKLVKSAGCALVTYRIRGGYFTYPRWAKQHHRKGHIEGTVVGIYPSTELKNLSVQEITDIINRDTYENAYETQREKKWLYTGSNKAEGMEHILFLCPCCRGMDTIRTRGDSFSCCACGMSGRYNDYGFLEGENLPYDNVLSWMRWIEPEFDSFVARNDIVEPLFREENVLLYQMLDGYQNKDLLTSTLSIYKDHMEINAYCFPFKEISSLSVLYGNILLFTHKGVYYGLRGDAFHAWKFGRLWHIAKGDTADRSKEI